MTATIQNPEAIESARRALHARLCACRGDVSVHGQVVGR